MSTRTASTILGVVAAFWLAMTIGYVLAAGWLDAITR